MTPSRQSGLTLVELLVTVTILAILATIAVPSFQRTIDNRRLIGAADNILADLRYAQSESIKRNADVEVEFNLGTNWSYTVKTDPNKTTQGSDYRGTVLSGTDELEFDPKRGTLKAPPVASTASITITSALGSKLSIEIDPLSHMRICTSTGMGGYPTCP